MGGNGDYVKHTGGNLGRAVPAGPGGGCVTKGPFGKYVSPLQALQTALGQNFVYTFTSFAW